MSSFRKSTSGLSVSSVKRLNGTRPFINNQTLISSGHSTMDSICGGGLPLGSMVFLESERFSCISRDLVRYFLAEGILVGHKSFVAIASSTGHYERMSTSELPLCLNQKHEQPMNSISPSNVDSKGTDLRIAWQYKKYLGDPSSNGNVVANSSTYCHSYDLSKSMQNEYLENNPLHHFDISKEIQDNTTLEEIYRGLFRKIRDFVEHQLGITNCENADQRKKIAWSKTVCRIAILGLGSSLWESATSDHCRLIYEFLRSVKSFIDSLPVVCMIPFRGYLFPTPILRKLEHLCDITLTLSSFAGEGSLIDNSHELSEFMGLLCVQKLPRVNSLTCHVPQAYKFGIKRERRKLKVEKLHLPPEGSRTATCSSGNIDF